MNLWQEFRQPTSITEAIEDLVNAPKPVIPIAGGSDLLLDIRQGRHAPVHTLIDLKAIPEMNLIELRGNELFIGASAAISRILTDDLVNFHAQALIEACNLIAGPQVRNTATLGGNVAHALPAADGTIALVALDAEAEVAYLDGLRRMAFTDLFLGPGKSAIDKSCELITGFYVPLVKAGQASCFKRIIRPQGVALPILNCAVWIYRSGETIKDVRIAVGPGGPTPFRAMQTESLLRDEVFSADRTDQAIEKLLSEAKFRTSPRRATADYRRHIVQDLFRETFMAAWQLAGR